MITTKNKRQHDGGISTIKDRAAHLVQALEKCPLEFIVKTLATFDEVNSPGTKSPSANRWIREFCGFESSDSNKDMEPIIEVLNDGRLVNDRATLIELMEVMEVDDLSATMSNPNQTGSTPELRKKKWKTFGAVAAAAVVGVVVGVVMAGAI